MRSSSVLVNVDPDIALKLAAYAAEIQGKTAGTTFLNKCNELAESNDITAVIDMLLSQTSVVFSTDKRSGKQHVCVVTSCMLGK